jgi:hypothetical protein
MGSHDAKRGSLHKDKILRRPHMHYAKIDHGLRKHIIKFRGKFLENDHGILEPDLIKLMCEMQPTSKGEGNSYPSG